LNLTWLFAVNLTCKAGLSWNREKLCEFYVLGSNLLDIPLGTQFLMLPFPTEHRTNGRDILSLGDLRIAPKVAMTHPSLASGFLTPVANWHSTECQACRPMGWKHQGLVRNMLVGFNQK
jgi:hypothetical protein